MSKSALHIAWEERLNEFEGAKQNFTAWCREKGFPIHQAKYWRRKLQSGDQAENNAPQWLSVDFNGTGRADTHRQSTALSIKVGSATIELQSGYNAELLKDVIRTLSTI